MGVLREAFPLPTSTVKHSSVVEEKLRESNLRFCSLLDQGTAVSSLSSRRTYRGDVDHELTRIHTAPAILSNLYIEGAITKFYPKYSLDRDGLEKFVKYFSWPGGFPSHVNVSLSQLHRDDQIAKLTKATKSQL